jgi:hypothetical protein
MSTKIIKLTKEAEETLEKIIGVSLILYGIVKCLVGGSTLFLPLSTLEKLSEYPILNQVITPDKTYASLYLEVFLVLFGVYSIAHGLIRLNVIKDGIVKEFIELDEFYYVFNALTGLCLAIFFYFVIFTDMNISKNPHEYEKYKTIGFSGGLIFLITVFVTYMYGEIKTYGIADAINFNKMAFFSNTMLIIIFSIVVIKIYYDYLFGDKPLTLKNLQILAPLNYF